MDDDDEFGDLYTDVLIPFSNSHPTLFPTPQKPDLNQQTTTHSFPLSNHTPTPIPPKLEIHGQNSPFKLNLIQVKKEEVEADDIGGLELRDVKVENGKGGIFMVEEEEEVQEKLDVEVDLDTQQEQEQVIIPGLSILDVKREEGSIGNRENDDDDDDDDDDDWDSDSEDDLQIVLNNDGRMGMMDRNNNEGMGSDDEDGEDLVIVANGDHQQQTNEEQEWRDDATQGGDGERKEAGENGKANAGVVSTGGTRIGYNNHMYHPHHSQFKYVRPGAAVVPGGAIVGPGSAPGQVRPPINMGPIGGRGRGDWRPTGLKIAPGMQKPFHSAWPNTSAGRGFGSGFEFTLPPHNVTFVFRTVFDIDIESFEDKPWRHPGADLSNFFNFELNEENWKDYCKQLEQLRLEATMQSKIRVYESGRSEQDYDPDLPPELAAAAGIQDPSAENPHLPKSDGELSDLTGQGRGASRARQLIPTGRAIQVECGYNAERLPSIDTRPPRIRDSDAIIEIVLQDSGDDDAIATSDADNDVQRDDLKDSEEDIAQAEDFDRLPQPYKSRKEMVGRREHMGSEGDEVLPSPPEVPFKYNPGSKESAPQEGRLPQGTSDRYSHQNCKRGNDVIACESAHVNKVHGSEREKSVESITVDFEVVREPSIEQKVDTNSEYVLDDSSVALEGDETDVDVIISGDTVRDGSPIPSVRRKKLSSRVEQPTVEDKGSVEGFRATRSSDNSKARSGSSKDYHMRRDAGEEEVIQEARSRRMEEIKKRRDGDVHDFRRKHDHVLDGRQEMDRSRMFVKVREDSHLSYPYRDWDLNPTHLSRVKTVDIERSRERDHSVGARQRRDDDTHGRRMKDEDPRKREHVDEFGYNRHSSKVRESERNDKEEHLHSRKRLDNGDWRGHHDKDVGLSHREKDNNVMIRHENFDDSHPRRKKEEEHLRREQADKEVIHGYKAREDTSRRKRERDDGLDQRKREDEPRVRDKPDDSHAVRQREESWRQRERDERKLKQPYEDMLSNRERDGRNSVRSGRDMEDKSRVGNMRVKDESKVLASDKDYPYKDKRRPNEHSKRNDRVEDDTFRHQRGRDSVNAREAHFIIEDRNLRSERSSSHNDRTSDSQLVHKERHRENRRGKDSDRTDQNTLGSNKRKQEDHNSYRNEKVSSRAASEHESVNVPITGHTSSRDPGSQSRLSSSTTLSKKGSHDHDAPQQRHSSKKHREDAPSDDEQQNLKRGRSKLERWTSNKDRDDFANSLSTSKAKESGRKNNDLSSIVSEQPDDQIVAVGSVEDQHPVGEEGSGHDLEMKDAGTEPLPGIRQVESDKVGDDRHLDTVAKLKKRSERFKTPMPTEKDTNTLKKVESEALVSIQSENVADAEVKPERPARKRRWIE
ncbi:hypothetical protein IFM89_030323 [Coptis chinensis]|uniref:Pre-mRNA polyadenylation factor Fip1 domain-containing protein n=1 Tax=Coptis chinensis TaxID=261450 RepID=A0A835MAD9_9MAGN|nr:hypothetical protein IFM89_030323 [Coptis chinensis]